MSDDGAMSEFDAATRVELDGTGVVQGGWGVGDNANGGYVLAILTRAMRRLAQQPDPLTVTANYLAPANAGPVRTDVAVLKSGRRFTTMTGSLIQGERVVLSALTNFGDVRSGGDGIDYDAFELPDLPPYEDCVPRPSSNGDVPAPLTTRVAVRLHPDDATYRHGTRSGTAVMRGWFAFHDRRPLDTLSLLLAADAFPPAVFNLDLPSGWVPTVTLTVQIRERPSPGPLRCRFTTRHVANGMFEEDGELWDAAGRLVALSRQLALIARAE